MIGTKGEKGFKSFLSETAGDGKRGSYVEPLEITAMANRITKPQQNKGKSNIPPKRGQIKAKIIGNLFKAVIAVASKAVGGLGRKKGEGGGGSSASTTPPPSTYTSDWHSHI
ncbi:hypothetical protein HHK36_018966 [Tetracentron sinense]|uniref:Uncharacterized protein n=1 Tax=Tetracentron sinense TaxID=13715 RepID=A0A835DBS6_TETSI|nr:hypothetical protein HHK36_018966 [Tetracentron sinense]